MVAVPSTSTLVDRQRAAKLLGDEIAAKTVLRDRLDAECKELIEARRLIIERSGYTADEYKKVEELHREKMVELEKRTVVILQDIEIIDERLADRNAALRVVSEDLQAAEAQLKSVTATLESLTNMLAVKEKDGRERLLVLEAALKDTTNRLASNTAKNEEVQAAYNKAIGELDSRHKKVEEEERLLAIKRTDLEIYETRLKAKYPNETIIV